MSYNICLVPLTLTVSSCLRNSSDEGNIWDSMSPFMTVLRQLEEFETNLPQRYALTELNLYMHKDQHTLGAVFSLHLLYHAALCDLTRISLPGFGFPLASAFQDAPTEFIAQCQQRCQFHARKISHIVRQGKSHGRVAFDDPFAADATFESTKVQIICSAIMPHTSDDTVTTTSNIIDNLELLNMLSYSSTEPNPCVRTFGPGTS